MNVHTAARMIQDVLAPRIVTVTMERTDQVETISTQRDRTEHRDGGPSWRVEFSGKTVVDEPVGGYIILSDYLLARCRDDTNMFSIIGTQFSDAWDLLETVLGHSIEEMRAASEAGELLDPDHYARPNICSDPSRHVSPLLSLPVSGGGPELSVGCQGFVSGG